MIRGALFDMDGVLIDSEGMGREIFNQLARERGYEVDDSFFINLLGITDEATLTLLQGIWGVDAPCQEIMAGLKQTRIQRALDGQMPVKTGIVECMQGLKKRGIRIALATSSPRPLVEQYIANIPPMQNVFDAMVCGEEAGRSKPAPDIYLEAARRIGVPIAECVGVEDSLSGMRSLRASGCGSVMIPDLIPCDERFSGLVDHRLESLHQLCGLIDRLNLKARVRA